MGFVWYLNYTTRKMSSVTFKINVFIFVRITRDIVHVVVFTIDYCHVFIYTTKVNDIFISVYRYEYMHYMIFPLKWKFVFVVYQNLVLSHSTLSL
jgi:hypothetical protein